jgi:leucyl aminopeptidase
MQLILSIQPDNAAWDELHVPFGDPGSMALSGAEGVHAALARVSDDTLHLQLSVDVAQPVAALRWNIDRVVRRVRQAFDLRGATASVRIAPGVPADAAAAVRLDVARAFGPDAVADDPALAEIEAAERTFRARVNEDPRTCTSLSLAAEVEDFCRNHTGPGRLTCDILDQQRLVDEGLNLLLAVGQASTTSPPRLVTATWTPDGAGAERAPWMLLGKGITFDTGGINVKPYESFVSHMRNDMAGAALAIALFRSLVAANYPRPLVLSVPTCENAVGENAMRPGTVVATRRGPSVKIDHTDAEGRLILADGLTWCEERYAPERTFCLATLTTAALTAYGPFATPIHFAEGDVATALMIASEKTGDDIHLLPRRPWHFEANRDSEADLRNTARLGGAMPMAAGSRNAAHFLLHFAKAPLVHADILGSTWNWGDTYPGAGFGATGAPYRLLLETFWRLADV